MNRTEAVAKLYETLDTWSESETSTIEELMTNLVTIMDGHAKTQVHEALLAYSALKAGAALARGRQQREEITEAVVTEIEALVNRARMRGSV